jgi:geranylgeranyl diphosphate synthase type II
MIEVAPASALPASELQPTFDHYRALVEPTLARATRGREPRRHLYDLIDGHMVRSGKAFRPSLCIATAEAFGCLAERTIPTAAALEMLHNAFLVHDDIEDGSETRRNRATLYREHGIPLAVNAGDGMQAMTLRILKANLEILGPDLSWRLMEEFDHLLLESIEGQAMELGWIHDNNCELDESDYLQMVLKKTCWYSFIHPCRMGALIARGTSLDVRRFDRFGYLLGAAFQIQDDGLNLTGAREKYGKEIGGDIAEGKRTLMLIHLMRRVTVAERGQIREILGKDRQRRTPDEIDWILALMRQHGSVDFARAAGRDLARAAGREFDTAFGDAPDGRAKAFLRAVVAHTIAREA